MAGPVGVYPEAARSDYVDTYRDPTVANTITPDDFLARARGWVQQGVQIIGGCSSIGVEYIRPLRAGLPANVPSPRRRQTRVAG